MTAPTPPTRGRWRGRSLPGRSPRRSQRSSSCRRSVMTRRPGRLLSPHRRQARRLCRRRPCWRPLCRRRPCRRRATVTPAEPDRGGLLRRGPFDVLTVRAVDEVGREGPDVVVQSSDGDARLVRHVDNSELPDGWTLSAGGSCRQPGGSPCGRSRRTSSVGCSSICCLPIGRRAL